MAEAPKGIVDRSVDFLHGFVRNSLPNERFKSSIPVYGGEIRNDQQGRMVYDTRSVKYPGAVRGVSSFADVTGDKFLRAYDDHFARDPLGMMLRHPGWGIEFIFRRVSPRYRGSQAQILENIKRLGLEEFYGGHAWGIEIKKPEIFNKGFALQDVLRAKEIGAPILADIDPLQALSESTAYIKRIHDTYGPVGDLVGDIMFQRKDGSRVVEPVLNIPDIILAPSEKRTAMLADSIAKQIQRQKSAFGQGSELTAVEESGAYKKALEVVAKEQKATDVLEHMVHAGFEVSRQSGNTEDVKKAMDAIIEAYGDRDVLNIVKRFLKRGRPTLAGKGVLRQVFMQHNLKHLMADRENADQVRDIAIQELTKYFPDVAPSPKNQRAWDIYKARAKSKKPI